VNSANGVRLEAVTAAIAALSHASATVATAAAVVASLLTSLTVLAMATSSSSSTIASVSGRGRAHRRDLEVGRLQNEHSLLDVIAELARPALVSVGSLRAGKTHEAS